MKLKNGLELEANLTRQGSEPAGWRCCLQDSLPRRALGHPHQASPPSGPYHWHRCAASLGAERVTLGPGHRTSLLSAFSRPFSSHFPYHEREKVALLADGCWICWHEQTPNYMFGIWSICRECTLCPFILFPLWENISLVQLFGWFDYAWLRHICLSG